MLQKTILGPLLGIAVLVYAEGAQKPIEPIPADKAAPRAGGCRPLDYTTLCVCAGYPIYQEGNDILYYAEVCSPSDNCAVDDVGYYWASELDWPISCIPQSNTCPPCDPFNELDALRRRVDTSTAFAGMSAKRNKADTAGGHILPADVTWKDGSGIQRVAHPRLGVKSEYGRGLYVTFTVELSNGQDKKVYAKLFVVRVKADGAAVNAPKPQNFDRLLFVGYEVGDLNSQEMQEAIPVERTEPAFRKTKAEDGLASEYVRKVSIGGNKFLVLLAK